MRATAIKFKERSDSRLLRVLGRQTPLRALDALVSALRPGVDQVPMGQTAIGLDANVFLRLGVHKDSSDVFDYLTSRHRAPLILPGQAIQEFWNNQLQAVDPLSQVIKRKFETLRSDIQKVDQRFGDFGAQFEQATSAFADVLDRFSAEHGHVYDEATTRRVMVLLEILQSKALVPYAPRESLRDIAMERKRSKTPPGFKDEGDGDFFIWADFLTGLSNAQRQGLLFSRVVLVSQDQKPDWSRGGMAHPILAAEVAALFQVPFEIWNIERLVKEVASAT